MASITGNVIDQNNIPVPNIVIRLMGGSQAPQTTLTAIDGSFRFNNQSPGTYTVSAIWGRSVVDQTAEITVGETDNSIIHFRVLTSAPNSSVFSYIVTNRYVLLKYGQYAFLAFIGWFFFDRLVAEQMPNLSLTKLTDLETARGVITYLVAVTTMSMAAILMLAAIMTGGKDLDKRFSLGKEILTLLIGILGTIIGFYYGSSNKSATTSSNGADTIRVDTVAFAVENKTVLAHGWLTGGIPHYIYSITPSPAAVVSRVTDKFLEDSVIHPCTLDVINVTKASKMTNFAIQERNKLTKARSL